MAEKFKLIRTKQCAKCPWKVSTNPRDIPGNYCENKHRNLKTTIAEEGTIRLGVIRVMACHHSNGKDQMYCIGWLHNQMDIGNNIALRIKMMKCENFQDVKIYGKQHLTFENTLPK